MDPAPWTIEEKNTLKDMILSGSSPGAIGKKLGRTGECIRTAKYRFFPDIPWSFKKKKTGPRGLKAAGLPKPVPILDRDAEYFNDPSVDPDFGLTVDQPWGYVSYPFGRGDF